MNFLLIAQLLEIATVAILVFVLVMLYYFGNIHFVRDFRLAFLLYLVVLVITLFEDWSFLQSWVEVLQLVLLSGSAFFIYQSVLEKDQKYDRKKWLSLLGLSLTVLTLVMSGFDLLHLAEGVGYIIFGMTMVVMGVRWMRGRKDLKGLGSVSKYLGAGFIAFGIHMMDFILVQYTGTGLVIGLFVASALEAYIACVLVLLNFAYLKAVDDANNQRYQDLFNNSSDAILIIDNTLITDCNDKALELFAMSKEEIVGTTPMDLSEDFQDNGRLSASYGTDLFASAQAGQLTKFEWLHKDREGRVIPCDIALFSTGENQFGAFIRDMTSQYTFEEEINFHKYYDGLTRLPKRVLFIDRLSGHLMEHPEKVALIAFNIDNFRQINDRYGHDYGDKLLVEVTKGVKANFSKPVTMTRLGADQFVVLMERLSHRDRVYIPIERIERIFRSPFEVLDESIEVTASMGVAFPESASQTPMALLKNVDLALTMAKKQGRGQLEFYSSDGELEFSRRMTMEQDMRLGIAEHEFLPYYQPIIEPKANKIIGAEALARWHKKDGGMIYPDVFIPIAEETDLISAIGEQILRQACIDCKPLLVHHPDFIMHVNLSPHQLKDRSILVKIKSVLEETGLNPENLQVELTETAFIEDSQLVNELLSEIRELGVKVALDDFGTGYSSLSYLTEMQVDTIKIDRKFIVKLPEDQKANALIRFLKSLIHSLGCKIVVEGVEEEKQLDLLMGLGCDYIQGYYFYRPMPYKDLLNLL